MKSLRILGSLLIWYSLLILLVAQFGAQATAADTVVYTGLGDSLAFGALAPPLKGYVYLYKNDITTDTGARVLLYDLGVPGWTSSDLLKALKTNLTLRLLVKISKVVTWNIGGNDLRAARDSYKNMTCGGVDNQDCLRAAKDTLENNWDAIIAELLSLRSTNKTIIRTMDIYNPFVSQDQSSDTWEGDSGTDFVVLKPYLDDVNDHIASTAANFGIPYAGVYEAFNGAGGDEDPKGKGYLSLIDGFHPNAQGHKVMADLLRCLGYTPLSAILPPCP
jgi:lysophospholipase L1-like esterase